MELENSRPTKKRQLATEERQRAVRACDECRRLKEKCEGGTPCKRCRHLRRTCIFNNTHAPTARRGPDAAASLKEVKELRDRVRYMETLLNHHFPRLPLDVETLRSTCEALPSWSHDYGQAGTSRANIESTAVQPASDSPGIEDEKCTVEYVDDTTAQPDPGSTSIPEIVALLPPRPVAAFLVNVFFRHATSIYYFVDKDWVKETLDDLQANSARWRSKDVPAACVVMMVLAVSTQYVHLETSKQNNRRGRKAPGGHDTPANWELEVGSTFYRQVAKSLSELIHAGSVLSVQAFLLLGSYSLPIDASGLGYIYLNLAVKVAIQNGMHRRVSKAVFDPRSKEIRRRIWWTVYYLPSSSIASSIDCDGFDATGLLESIDLTCQAEAFLYQISQLRTCPRSEAGTIMDRIKQMKTKLQRPWTSRQPDLSSPSNRDRAELSESRARLHARLECCLVHMFIGRPFILAHRQPETTPSASSPPYMRWQVLIEDCISAANEVIDICHGMQKGGMGLAKSSYTEYSACRASLLVLIAYSIFRRTNEFSSNLQKGLDAIREMASVGDSARSEVSLLETLEAALHRLEAFDIESHNSTPDAGEEPAQDGYEGLLDWYTKTAGAMHSRSSSSSMPMNVDHQAAKTTSAPPGAQPAPHGNSFTPDCLPEGHTIDEYPFNLDLFNMDRNIAFFTSDFNDHGNAESELFENLLCMPRQNL
ncbi:hypothetical protein yc1106_04110 [Curvularia clavata]|uniref:Zn(2)-C6 fungal-type domain-containing protein n=1 Tax=Curvularia clavata TaxID=95742 RepID=A0A9Q9DSW2_CURCL|nr:hypothetical protein yc1106_04110 [Curvularia clavata]